jgi:hypothetical protein
MNRWSVIPGDPAHRVRARLRESGPVSHPAPGTEARDVGRVLRLLREHSPMDSRIRRDQRHAEHSATPIRVADEPPLAAGSTPGGADHSELQSYRRGAPETTLAADYQALTNGRNTLCRIIVEFRRSIALGDRSLIIAGACSQDADL